MSPNPDDLLPTAKDFMKKLALAEAEEAEKAARQHAKAEAEKQALQKQLEKPSGVSDDERIKRAVRIIERAVHRSRARHQSAGTRVGKHPDGRAKGTP